MQGSEGEGVLEQIPKCRVENAGKNVGTQCRKTNQNKRCLRICSTSTGCYIQCGNNMVMALVKVPRFYRFSKWWLHNVWNLCEENGNTLRQERLGNYLNQVFRAPRERRKRYFSNMCQGSTRSFVEVPWKNTWYRSTKTFVDVSCTKCQK